MQLSGTFYDRFLRNRDFWCPRRTLIGLLAAVLTALLVVALHQWAQERTVQKLPPGDDFYAYWCAHELAWEGENPYDYARFSTSQLNRRAFSSGPVYFSPWTFAVLFPVMVWSYPTSFVLWTIVNVLLVFLCTGIVWRLISGQSPDWRLCAVVGFSFAPVLQTLALGQVSLVVLAGVCAAAWALERRSDYLAGLLLGLAFIKPHLVYLLWPVLILWIFGSRRWAVLAGLASAAAMLSALVAMLFPHLFSAWLSAAGVPVQWKAVSVVTPVRVILAGLQGSVPNWPVYWIPVASVIAALVLFAGRAFVIDWPKALAGLICFSVFTAPYVWIFDHAVLLYVEIALVALLMSCSPATLRRFLILAGFVVFQLLLLVLNFLGVEDQRLFWVPMALWLMWWQANTLARHASR